MTLAPKLLQLAERLRRLNHHTEVPFHLETELVRAYAGAPDLYEGLNRLARSLSTKAVTLRARGLELEAEVTRPAGWAEEDALELNRLVEEIDSLLESLGAPAWAATAAHPRGPGEEEWIHVGTVRTDRGDWSDLYYERGAVPEPVIWVRSGPSDRDRAGIPLFRVSQDPQSWGRFGLAYFRIRSLFGSNPRP